MKSQKEILDRIRHLEGREKDGVDVSVELETLRRFQLDDVSSLLDSFAYSAGGRTVSSFRKIRTLMWMLED